MKILVCGVGALGSNLVANLAADLRGEHSISVIDRDSVQERNVSAGTQFYSPDQIGVSKAEALQYNIFRWFEREINVSHGEINNHSAAILRDKALIVDCFDNSNSRRLIQTHFENEGVARGDQVLHMGFSKHFTFAIEWAGNYKIPSDIKSGFDICEMPGASSFVKMVAALGSSVVQDYINNKIRMDYIGNKFSFTKMHSPIKPGSGYLRNLTVPVNNTNIMGDGTPIVW